MAIQKPRMIGKIKMLIHNQMPMIMKIIKNTLFVIVAVLLSLYVVSCGEDYSSPLKGQNVSDQTFEPRFSSKTVTIGTKDLSNCTVSCSANWCHATIEISSVVITVQPNDTYEERQAIITLTDPEDATTLTFKVVQKQNEAIIPENSSYSIPEEGGEITINIKSNVNYKVVIPSSVDWLKLKESSTRSLEKTSFVLSANKNDSGGERSAIIKLASTESSTSKEITVLQEFNPYITLDKKDADIDELGGIIEVTINTNVPYVTEFSNDWVKDEGKTKVDENIYLQKFSVSPNTNYYNRSANITIKNTDSKNIVYKIFSILQNNSIDVKNIVFELRSRGASANDTSWGGFLIKNFTKHDVKLGYVQAYSNSNTIYLNGDLDVVIKSMDTATFVMSGVKGSFLADDFSSFSFTMYMYLVNIDNGSMFKKKIKLSKEALSRDVIITDFSEYP